MGFPRGISGEIRSAFLYHLDGRSGRIRIRPCLLYPRFSHKPLADHLRPASFGLFRSRIRRTGGRFGRRHGNGSVRFGALCGIVFRRNGLGGTPAHRLDGSFRYGNIRGTGSFRNFLHGLLAGTSAPGLGRSFLRPFRRRNFSAAFAGALLLRRIRALHPFTRQFRNLLPCRPLAGGRGRTLFRPGNFRSGVGLCRSFRRRLGSADNTFFGRWLRRNLFRSQIWGGIRHGKENWTATTGVS